jgi:hypothetical protein
MANARGRKVQLEFIGDVLSPVVGAESQDGMLAVLLKEGPEDFETREYVAFAFHWVD